jgi:hypothetical protein
MEKRQQDIVQTGLGRRFFKEAPLEGRNAHMRGTTSALRLLFGYDVGSDYDQEWISVNKAKVHLFECFSLVNYMMCAAFDDETSNRGNSTETMQENCARHFSAILHRLRPTVIVLQGVWVRQWISKYGALELPKKPPACHFERVQIGDTESSLLSFSHPSQPGNMNWGRNDKADYLIHTVVPTIRECLSQLGSANT